MSPSSRLPPFHTQVIGFRPRPQVDLRKNAPVVQPRRTRLGGQTYVGPGGATKIRSLVKEAVLMRSHVFLASSLCVALLASSLKAGEAAKTLFQQTDVFVSGQVGYHTFRIPALIVSPKGTLLAFGEGRKDSRRDGSPTALVLKRGSPGAATTAPPGPPRSSPLVATASTGIARFATPWFRSLSATATGTGAMSSRPGGRCLVTN